MFGSIKSIRIYLPVSKFKIVKSSALLLEASFTLWYFFKNFWNRIVIFKLWSNRLVIFSYILRILQLIYVTNIFYRGRKLYHCFHSCGGFPAREEIRHFFETSAEADVKRSTLEDPRKRRRRAIGCEKGFLHGDETADPVGLFGEDLHTLTRARDTHTVRVNCARARARKGRGRGKGARSFLAENRRVAIDQSLADLRTSACRL